MLSGGSIEATESEWGQAATESVAGWQDIDRKLRLIARKRSALDAAEAALLRDADRVAIWQEFSATARRRRKIECAWRRRSNSYPR